jgi:hypothetical protein
MYYLYSKRSEARRHRFTLKEETHLFGCNKGMIPHLLKISLASGAEEPLFWHINVGEMLARDGKKDCALIIDLKPKQRETNLSLYEVAEVWGASAKMWTPLMLHLRGLFVDENPRRFKRDDFVRTDDAIVEPIFSMMYVHGSISGGALVEKWLPPGASFTNSVLLWPDSMKYFAEKATEVMSRTKS